MKNFYGVPMQSRRRGPIGMGRRSTTGFAMAATNRLFEDWTPGTVSSDSILLTNLLRMRNRSRQLARDEDYAKSFLGACRNNIVGPNGIGLQMDVRDPSGESDDLANDAIEEGWRAFSQPWAMNAEGRRVPHFTASGKLGRVGLEQLCVQTAARDGDGLLRLVRGFDNPFKFTVQPINPDYLDEEKNETLRDGGKIRLGVQTNKWGEATHYWLRTANPGDIYRATGAYTSEPVPASDIIHYYLPDDFELSRGYPWIHAGATRLKMLAGYEEAALENARSAACKDTYFKQVADQNGEYRGDEKDDDGNWLADSEPGTKELLPRGIEPIQLDPKFPHAEHKGFITATLMGVAAGLQVSALTLTGDLSQANYSSMRAGLLPERDQWTLLQGWFILQVELPLFMEWLRMALLAGAIKTRIGSVLPAHRFDKFAKPLFQGRRWPWVDPSKDMEASETALRLKIGTRTDIVGQTGGDLEDTFRTLAHEEELAAKHKIELPDLSSQPAATPQSDPALEE